MDEKDFWVQENKDALKMIKAMGLKAQVKLPHWKDVRTALLQSRARHVVDGITTTGNLTIQGVNYTWAPQNGVNLGGQYQNLSTVKFGNRIYIRVYAQDEIGSGFGQCQLSNFTIRVLQDLLTLAHYKTGRALLQSIHSAANCGSVLIKFCNGFSSTAQADPTSGANLEGLPPFTGAARGENYNMFVQYNPAIFGLPIMVGNDDPAYGMGQYGHPTEKPADVTLFHELVHADDVIHGMFDATLIQRGTASVKLSEMRAVGLDALRRASYSENAYRAERGFIERTYYSDSAGEVAVPLNPIVLHASHGHVCHYLGIDAPVPEETSHSQIIPRLNGAEHFTWPEFKSESKASGMRNKVKPLDAALKALDDAITQETLLNVGLALKPMTGGSAGTFRDRLKAVFDACETYLNLPKRQASLRIPGIRALQAEAARFFVLYSIVAGDPRNYQAIFQSLHNPKVRDVDGNAQFGVAIEKQRSADILRWLIAQRVDPNDRHRGLRPLDLSRIGGLMNPEKVLAGEPLALSDLPDNIPGGKVDRRDECLRILEAGTWVDPNVPFDKAVGYRALWDSRNGLLRPILKAAAISMHSGSRLAAIRANNAIIAPVPLRVYVYADGKSTCHTLNNVVTVLRYSSQQAIEGGLIHEMSHFVNLNIFKNEVMPFAAVDPTTDGQAYIEAITADFQRSGCNQLITSMTPFLKDPAPLVNGPTKTIIDRQGNAPNADTLQGVQPIDRFVFTLYNRLLGYLVGNQFRQVAMPILQEAIVSFPQALHAYGDTNDATTHAPAMFAYFRDTWLAALTSWVDTHKIGRVRRGSITDQRRPRIIRRNSVLI